MFSIENLRSREEALRHPAPIRENEVDQRPAGWNEEGEPGTDKLAEYGLTALVVGGGAAVLAQTGLLAKLWKPIAAFFVALGLGVKKLFSRSPAEHDPEKPIV